MVEEQLVVEEQLLVFGFSFLVALIIMDMGHVFFGDNF